MLPSERRRRRRARRRGRTFDVQPSTDDRSLNHPVRPLLATLTATTEPFQPYAKAWRRGGVLNQGQEGACVGHGVTQELASEPVPVRLTEANLPPDVPTTEQELAFWLYRTAQRDDEFEGEDYSGTSVNAGMRVARSLGLLPAWRWAETREDFRDSLIQLGPVVLAIPWHTGMYEAPGGLLRVTGEQVGWHCIVANAWHPSLSIAGSPKGEKYRLINSWGTGWGTYGSAWIDADELWNLIEANDGEMVVPLSRSLAAVPV